MRSIGGALLIAVLAAGCSERTLDEDPWDPRGIYNPGTLNPDAVAFLRNNGEIPLLWLGEEFEGLHLTFADNRPAGMVTIIYGDCDAEKANPREPSCFPAIQMQIKPPGAIARIEALTPQPGHTTVVTEIRGLRTYRDGGNLVVDFTNGMSLTVFNILENNDELLAALRSANHEALGVPEVPAGEPLGAFTAH